MSAATVNVPVIDLGGAALNWAVQSIVFSDLADDGTPVKSWVMDRHSAGDVMVDYCRDWAAGGPVIEGAGISLDYRPMGGSADWCAYAYATADYAAGPSALVAAMRCHVMSRTDGASGRAVSVPAALVPAHLVPAEHARGDAPPTGGEWFTPERAGYIRKFIRGRLEKLAPGESTWAGRADFDVCITGNEGGPPRIAVYRTIARESGQVCTDTRAWCPVDLADVMGAGPFDLVPVIPRALPTPGGAE